MTTFTIDSYLGARFICRSAANATRPLAALMQEVGSTKLTNITQDENGSVTADLVGTSVTFRVEKLHD